MSIPILTFREFIKSEIQKDFEWGQTDCCSTVDRWLINVNGFSPKEKFKLIYFTKEEAEEILSEGLLRIGRRCLKQFKTIKKPITGDVGIIPIINTHCFAIKTENSWFTRNETGIVCVDVKPIIAWSICHKPSSL